MDAHSLNGPDFAGLVAKARSGGPRETEALLVRTLPLARRVVRAFLISDPDAADVLQDCLVAVVRSLDSLAAPEKYPAFVVRTCSARCIGHLQRRRRRLSKFPGRSGNAPEAKPDAGAKESLLASLWAERTLAIQRLIAELPEQCRRALTLHVVEGLEPVEVARRMGMKRGTVKSLLDRGIRTVRERLESGE